MNKSIKYDVIIIGAGASGMVCAIRAGQRGLSTLIIDKANKIGKKILISGGGRCNFTNMEISSKNYLSPNPHFCKSALSRYTQWHFIEMLNEYELTYSEKKLGQLFCDQKSKAIKNMLLDKMLKYKVNIITNKAIKNISFEKNEYKVNTLNESFSSSQLVIASGGPSFPNISGSDFALRIAKQFNIKNKPFCPALVPLKLNPKILKKTKLLSGLSHFVCIKYKNISFLENILFTHKGISGPATLQISSYWEKGEKITIDLSPNNNHFNLLKEAKIKKPSILLSKYLYEYLPKKLAIFLLDYFSEDLYLQHLSDKKVNNIARNIHNWEITPIGNEGMKKAEVSTGGISPDELSSKTFECKKQNGLFFIGESIDVTGWLGGYNFQWAWSSGWCCGDSLRI